MVGAVRFELTTSCTRNKRATRLRYAPTEPKRCRVFKVSATQFVHTAACAKIVGCTDSNALSQNIADWLSQQMAVLLQWTYSYFAYKRSARLITGLPEGELIKTEPAK